MTTSDHLQWSNRISAVNAYWEPLSFELPSLKSGNAWRRWIDVALTHQTTSFPGNKRPQYSIVRIERQTGPGSCSSPTAESKMVHEKCVRVTVDSAVAFEPPCQHYRRSQRTPIVLQ